MKYTQLSTYCYRKEGWFTVHGKYYLINSYVKLTPYGKEFLETDFDSVQLTEHFHFECGSRKAECHKFVIAFRGVPPFPYTMSTDEPLERLIEEVIIPAKYEPPNKKPEPVRIKNRDWEVPDVRIGWVIFLVFFFGVEIFKDWAVKLILRYAGGWLFSNWRNMRMIEEGYVDFKVGEENKK